MAAAEAAVVSLISDSQVERALKHLHDWDAAKARADHEYLDDLTKTLLAELGEQAGVKSATARDAYARSHPDYRAHLEAKRAAAERDYRHRQRLAASQAVVDLYRTQAASQRGRDRPAYL